MRLIFAGTPLRSRTRSRASAGLSLKPFQHHVFEGDTARIRGAGIGAGTRRSRFASADICLLSGTSVVAQSRHARHAARSPASAPASSPSAARVCGTTPAVETVMRRRDSDSPSPSERTPISVAHRFEIVERLAHAHEDEVRDGTVRVLVGHQTIRLAATRPGKSPSLSRATTSWATISCRRQVAHELLRAGVAERTGERAADLARDAQRAAVALREYRRIRSRSRARSPYRPWRPARRRISHLRVPSASRPVPLTTSGPGSSV